MMSLSGSRRGEKMVITVRFYVAPVRRVKQVLEGKEKKSFFEDPLMYILI